MLLRKIFLVMVLGLVGVCSYAQTDSLEVVLDSVVMDTVDVEDCINKYFVNYKPKFRTGLPIALDRFVVNDELQTLDIYAKEGFASQVFTQEDVDEVYRTMRSYLPEPYDSYDIRIYGFGLELQKLVPNYYTGHKDRTRLWGPISYEGNEWVRNVSRPINITRGLQGAHLTIWPSHGRYYDFGKGKWKWQRPNLYCTNEDQFTRSFVVPFLLPMLENSGAVAYSPRERDEHSFEIIVDNDTNNISQQGMYVESVGVEPFVECEVPGFVQNREIYTYGSNPHKDGTARSIMTTSDITSVSTCSWVPVIPEDGDYAVYVTYPQTELNVPDATYTVRHRNIATQIRVNQQMGAGTWVYLGTFNFAKGTTMENSISLSNYSENRGVINADAIRIGGGMGNVERNGKLSGLPRYLEGSLYYSIWAGMPDSVYNTKNEKNDYADDINVRSNTLNYLAGGSPYMPDSEGLGVPMEMSLAMHSDAGARADDTSIVGTLSIYTYKGDRETNDLLSGVDRMASSDLASLAQMDICRDLSALIGRDWTRRELYNRNYSECRKPEVPSMILETLSHQNFADMLLGHDPNFKFTMSRAVYKAITRFVATQHERDYVIQPLSVRNFAAEALDGEVRLSWQPQEDKLEPTATPTSYIVYTSREGNGFDNGVLLANGATSVTLPVDKDVLYRFKVTACNDGGESFPSEVLTALSASNAQSHVMIANGFTRLSAPATIANRDSVGFDIKSDIGVPYINTAEYCGAQTGFLRSKIRVESAGGLGYSGTELEGKVIAGNSFDYPSVHAAAMRDEQKTISISSASMDALVQKNVDLGRYNLLDVVFGLQKDDGNSSVVPYKTYTPEVCQLLNDYMVKGGNVFVSGAYIARDMTKASEQKFTSERLNYTANGMVKQSAATMGNTQFTLVSKWNPDRYVVQSADVLNPVGAATPFVTYEGGECAAVASNNVVAMGFPFEAIVKANDRKAVMKRVLQKLLYKM